jgi:exonuclease SbcC
VRVLELSLRNYRVFEEVDLELPARVIGIFGENGSGKSTLMESIAFALYGVDAARTKKDAIRTHGTLADCAVRMVFEHGGREYELRRALKGRGSAPDAELFGGGLLLASGVTDVDGEVARLLHMDLRVFRASVYAEQKQLDAFSEVTSGKRKEMALRLLGIRPVDEARKAARGESRSTRQSAEQLAGAIADTTALEAELKEAKDRAREVKALAASAAKELREAERTAKTARKAFAAIDAARERVEKLTVQIVAATQERARVAADVEELAARVRTLTDGLEGAEGAQAELAALDGIEERRRQAVRLVEVGSTVAELERELASAPAPDAARAIAEVTSARDAATAARERAAVADGDRARAAQMLALSRERLARAAEADPAAPCPTCGQPLGGGFEAYLQHCRDELSTSEAALTTAATVASAASVIAEEAATRLGETEAETERTREGAAIRAQAEDRLARLRADVAALAAPFGDVAPDLDALARAVHAASELRDRLARLQGDRDRLAESERDLAKAKGRVGELGATLASLTEEAGLASFDAREHGRVRDERDSADAALEASRAAERAAADAAAGVETTLGELTGRLAEARELEQRVGDLQTQARELERVAMLLDGFRDHLVARVGPELSREAEALFRELTNHEYDDLRIDEETLSIHIADGDTYFPVERFSGSEADLANLALRVAISVHLSRMAGADLGVMVLDEVLGSLDAERKDLLVRSMGSLAAQFHQLFVITHAEQVKDRFAAAIDVRKVGRRRSVATLL